MRWAVVMAGMLLASQAVAETPYVYQQGGLEGEQRTAVESQTTLGTRELRPLGGRGIEQGVRVRHQILDGTTLEAFGGAVWQPDATDLRAGAIGAEVIQRVLTQKSVGVSLQIALGGYRDVTGVFVPRARVLVGRSWGRLHTQVSGNLEAPISRKRDGLDMILGAAAAWQVSAQTSIGLEAVGEDLEAIWDPSESEGGARLLAGPSLHTQFGALYVHGNIGATTWWPVAGSAPLTGALGRVNVGWRF